MSNINIYSSEGNGQGRMTGTMTNTSATNKQEPSTIVESGKEQDWPCYQEITTCASDA